MTAAGTAAAGGHSGGWVEDLVRAHERQAAARAIEMATRAEAEANLRAQVEREGERWLGAFGAACEGAIDAYRAAGGVDELRVLVTPSAVTVRTDDVRLWHIQARIDPDDPPTLKVSRWSVRNRGTQHFPFVLVDAGLALQIDGRAMDVAGVAQAVLEPFFLELLNRATT